METLFRHNAANRSSTCASSRAAFFSQSALLDVVREGQILRLLNGALEGEHVAGTEEDAVAKQGTAAAALRGAQHRVDAGNSAIMPSATWRFRTKQTTC